MHILGGISREYKLNQDKSQGQSDHSLQVSIYEYGDRAQLKLISLFMPFVQKLTLGKTVRKSCCTLFGNHNIFIWITFDRAPKLNSVQSFILSTIVVGALNSKIESFHQQIVMHQLLCQSYCMHHKILNLIVVRLLKCFH